MQPTQFINFTLNLFHTVDNGRNGSGKGGWKTVFSIVWVRLPKDRKKEVCESHLIL